MPLRCDLGGGFAPAAGDGRLLSFTGAQPGSIQENQLFGSVSMKLDTFSKINDLSGSGRPDGIEALIEFDDRFGDRTKAAGNVYFELFGYRPGWPDPRGAAHRQPVERFAYYLR